MGSFPVEILSEPVRRSPESTPDKWEQFNVLFHNVCTNRQQTNPHQQTKNQVGNPSSKNPTWITGLVGSGRQEDEGRRRYTRTGVGMMRHRMLLALASSVWGVPLGPVPVSLFYFWMCCLHTCKMCWDNSVMKASVRKTTVFTLFQPAAQNRFVLGPTAATVCADAVGFAATAAATSCSSPPSWSYMTKLSNTSGLVERGHSGLRASGSVSRGSSRGCSFNAMMAQRHDTDSNYSFSKTVEGTAQNKVPTAGHPAELW